MTPADLPSLVERMAREAGMSNDGVMWYSACADNMDVSSDDLARFAQLVAEECCRINEQCLGQGFLNPSAAIRQRFGLDPASEDDKDTDKLSLWLG